MNFSASTFWHHQFSARVQIMPFLVLFRSYKFSNKILKIDAETALSNGAIWDEFSKQHYQRSIKNAIVNARLARTFLIQI